MKEFPKVAGIVLAAGRGTRMGQTKQLLPFRGQTILECVVDSALASKLHRVVVVLGHQAELIEPLLKGRPVSTVFNDQFASGQSTSLKAGLNVLTAESDAALFLLADQPLVRPETIDSIIAAYHSSAAQIVVPVHEGRRGNPALFARETFPGIQSLSGDCGARSLFDAYGKGVVVVEVASDEVLTDIDTAEDYRRLQEDG